MCEFSFYVTNIYPWIKVLDSLLELYLRWQAVLDSLLELYLGLQAALNRLLELYLRKHAVLRSWTASWNFT